MGAAGTRENVNNPHPNPCLTRPPKGEGTKVWPLLKKDNFTPFMVYQDLSTENCQLKTPHAITEPTSTVRSVAELDADD